MSKPLYKDHSQPTEKRVEDLISRLTLEEKISQMVHYSSAIPRLDIPEYNWWNECLHGVARAGVATVFPQAIAMAASFDFELMFEVATVISDEARAKYHEFTKYDDRGIHKGLTFWSPNINIFRDPRWGRGQETYGEDPYLSGEMGVAFVRGLQGDNSQYFKVIATPKHFAVHSGPEPLRHEFNARVSEKELRETYLPAFKKCIKKGEAYSVMGAYNRTNGEPCCGSKTLLQDILRNEWEFDGYVVSDCGAVSDFHEHHEITDSPAESAAMAVKNGCDLNCGENFEALLEAVNKNLISEEELDKSLKRLFKARFKLGMFDPEEEVPYTQISYEINDQEEHRQLSAKMAKESMVLLKNEDSILPLDEKEIDTLAVIGPNADNKDVLLGNYYGTPSRYQTALTGLRDKLSDTRIYYTEGCDLTTTIDEAGARATDRFSEAKAAASRADAVIMCMGISPALEGEEGAVANSDGGGDRTSLELPGIQQELLKSINKLEVPVILVLFNGSPLALNWEQENIPVILEAWYPGAEGGSALADILFGDHNPSGRLPITFVQSLDQLPSFTNYSMENRTYRYMQEKPLYPFGYGLSYTDFKYSNLQLSAGKVESGEDIEMKVEVTNDGPQAGAEVVQMYLKDLKASVRVPLRELKGIKKVNLEPGEKTTVSFTLSAREMALIDDNGDCILEPGKFRIYVGGRQPDARSEELTDSQVLSAEFEVQGEKLELEY